MTENKKLPSIIYLTRNTRNALNNSIVFTKRELTFLFGEEKIVTWLKMNCYFFQSSDCRWRKTEKLNELLTEGIEEINTETI